MWRGKTISVVFSTYRERASIRRAIEDFFSTGFVDEVIVVNNNAEPGTDEEVRMTRAKLIHEPRQGYGHGYQAGIRAASGDYVVLCEPDGTFAASDLERFLVYAKDFDIVLGSRCGQSTPLSGANMGVARKFANVFEAKTIEVFFNTNALTDIGCTYKLFRREALTLLTPLWRTTNSLFATELVLLTVSENLHFIEIPVTFRKRVGESTTINSSYKLVKWAILIQLFIIRFWFRWITQSLWRRMRR